MNTNIKTLDDVIAAMNEINAKYDKPARIKTIDDIIPVMDEINEKYDTPITNIKTIDDVKEYMEQKIRMSD